MNDRAARPRVRKMVSCKQCNTLNSLDSAFCKKCGVTLDANEIAIANEKLTTMIADGNKLFAEGRTEDALMVAETAINSNPTSAVAVSLKGMCLERKGQLAEALECFERVVELQPDSTLDKLKVNDLKNLLAVEKFEVTRTPDRRMAVMSAVAATVLVVTCGAIFAKANASGDKPVLVAQNEAPNRTFGEVMEKQAPIDQQQPMQNNQQVNPGVQNPNPSGIPNPMPDNSGRTRLNLGNGRYDGGSLPQPEGGMTGGIGPVTINPDDIPQGNRNTQSSVTAPPTGDKGLVDPPPVVQDPPKADPPKNDPGIIEIEVSRGTPNRNNGGSETTSGNGRTALLATARSQMSQGNYSAAATTYERALRSGADQGSTNQRLGQCYAQLGRNGDAVAAYSRAAAAFEKSGNTQGADACKQAIKVLGG